MSGRPHHKPTRLRLMSNYHSPGSRPAALLGWSLADALQSRPAGAARLEGSAAVDTHRRRWALLGVAQSWGAAAQLANQPAPEPSTRDHPRRAGPPAAPSARLHNRHTAVVTAPAWVWCFSLRQSRPAPAHAAGCPAWRQARQQAGISGAQMCAVHQAQSVTLEAKCPDIRALESQAVACTWWAGWLAVQTCRLSQWEAHCQMSSCSPQTRHRPQRGASPASA